MCKINDMASNTLEWTTEYVNYKENSRVCPCAPRGGLLNNNFGSGIRGFYAISAHSVNDVAFRYILHI